MYSVRIYKSTGLNAVNIIDKPSRLNDDSIFDFEDLPALNILQNVFLDSVRVKVSWEKIKNADYCRIGNSQEGYFYYFVTGVAMRSVDVAELALLPDFITSAGGIDNVEILDGIVTRCHVSDDSYGAWNIEDEFLTPSEPLLLDTEMVTFSNESTTYIESSLDLGAMACVASSEVYIDSEKEGVQVPKTYTNILETHYSMDDKTGALTHTTLMPVSDMIMNGVNVCRALGVESAVRSMVVIPNSLIQATTALVQASATVNEDESAVTLSVPTESGSIFRVYFGTPRIAEDASWQIATQLRGVFVDTQTQIPYEYQNVNNKRVLYGKLNKIGIITTAGNRLESNPEETRSGDANVTIRSVGDPHPTGAPYHRFKTMNGNSSKSGFFMNAIKGLQWKQIPLMYSAQSGNALNAINFQNSREMADLNYSLTPTGAGVKALESLGVNRRDAEAGVVMMGGAIGAIGGMGAGALTGNPVGALAGGVGGMATGAYKTAGAIAQYDTARRQEMQQFAIQQNVSSPEISISYDGEAFRDFYGETVIVYRYRPTPTDVRRLDNILTMYGYKVNIAGKDAPTNNRKYFNYLMGNLTVGGNIPKWQADGISLQIANGVRIWHTKPSSDYYESNPVR